MAKVKTVFICRNCGTESAKWIGRCPSCNQWNTYIEEKVIPASKDTVHQRFSDVTSVPTPIGNIEAKKISRISSTISEFDRLLGGGIVRDLSSCWEVNPVLENLLLLCSLPWE